jgi:hypothetical protein
MWSGETPVDASGARLLFIDQVERIAPFLMTVVSDSDLWMYLSSAHGLTGGRGEAERCLFPYETDDRLHQAGGLVGPVTVLRVVDDEGTAFEWRPFNPEPTPGTQRRLYKTELGDRVIFEEHHPRWALTFRYQWAHADRYGFVRTSELSQDAGGRPSLRVEVLDGLRGIMPAGVALGLQQKASNLVDAYRRSERVPGHPRVATYALSARIVDRAEPAEALRANVVWSAGLPGARVLLDDRQLERFRRGDALPEIDDHRGRPGSYLLAGALHLAPGERLAWDIVADVDRSQSQVVALLDAPGSPEVQANLRSAIRAGSDSLRARLASADGIQHTGRATNDVHHLANVLFNCLRGGVFLDDYRAPAEDVRDFITSRNRPVAARHHRWLLELPATVDCRALVEEARASGDLDLARLTLEYLPLVLSRRHGDPSRPWNAFSIRVRHPDGRPLIAYQGNWRDIFQNWEALLCSFPGFLPQVVAKFLNASTIDGFNPYRISQAGIDWEASDPHDEWGNFGYWGDHQIVYLTRLLEAMEAYWPGTLARWLDVPMFSYANVPYRLKGHQDIVADPRRTIHFDTELAKQIDRRVAELGADGRLWINEAGEVVHATLAEKLLVPVLAKLGQLVPEGGIWMNTQRPEWNDANNALAGFGLSMVTLYQLRRHLVVLEQLFDRDTTAHLSPEVAAWMDEVQGVLDGLEPNNQDVVSDVVRRQFLDGVGRAAERYRNRVYPQGTTAGAPRALRDLQGLCRRARALLEHSIRRNRRPDGLYHAYNLLTVAPGEATARVDPMYEMLEGQVAVLSCGLLSAEEAVALLDALWESAMVRPEHGSFMLYPDRDLPGFLEKNVIAVARLAEDPLLTQLLAAGRSEIVERDAQGNVRFGADFRHAGDLQAALDRLASDREWTEAIARGRSATLETFELTFHHHAFTGRSGTMFRYEGLGSIYWHMVSKLLLAVAECLRWAERTGPRPTPWPNWPTTTEGSGPASAPTRRLKATAPSRAILIHTRPGAPARNSPA